MQLISLQNKQALRRQLLQRRRSLTSGQRLKYSRIILEELYCQMVWQSSQCVMAYSSMEDEVQLEGLLKRAMQEQKRLCLPYITGKGTMEAVQLNSLQELVPGEYGILTVDRAAEKIISPKELDLIIVPGVAFTNDGKRLGMGAGFYDRFLAKRAPQTFRLALAYSCQMVDDLPIDSHDERVQAVITEWDCFSCT